jgi:hypothetical protein
MKKYRRDKGKERQRQRKRGIVKETERNRDIRRRGEEDG